MKMLVGIRGDAAFAATRALAVDYLYLEIYGE